jgi:hypothetical protein
MADLFKDIIPSILQTKKDCLDNEKDYVPYVVNKALSQHMDCIMYANQMNLLPNTDKSMQYSYLLNTVRPYKRPYQKWLKKEKLEDLEVIKEYYKYSDEKARAVMSLLSAEQLDDLKKRIHKGGLNNGAESRRTNRGQTNRA